MNILQLICEYRTLKVRHDLGHSLNNLELHRLHANERALGFRGEEGPPNRRRFARVDVEIPAVCEVGAEERDVVIVNLSGGGMVVKPAPEMSRGDLAVIRVRGAPAAGDDIRLPAQAVWASSGPNSAVGLSFIGVPD